MTPNYYLQLFDWAQAILLLLNKKRYRAVEICDIFRELLIPFIWTGPFVVTSCQVQPFSGINNNTTPTWTYQEHNQRLNVKDLIVWKGLKRGWRSRYLLYSSNENNIYYNYIIPFMFAFWWTHLYFNVNRDSLFRR